jgi:uncharacterized cupin superfamily protein
MNLLGCELDEALDRPGFGHRAAAVGERIGGVRIGAAVYEALSGVPIWPYHYHCGSEEWLYVLSGAPVLRDPAGERELGAGDVVCFPANHLGAHTFSGPGRFIVFSADAAPGPHVTVYPDSDKLSVWPGPDEVDGLNALRLPRAADVDYWYGEGDGPLDPVEVVREPAAPSLPVVNMLAEATLARPTDSSEATPARSTDSPQEACGRSMTVGPERGARLLSVTAVAADPGESSTPYHCVYGRERWLLVLSGSPSLRHPGGEDRLGPADVVCLPEGPAGAHQLLNRSAGPARALLLSTTGFPANTYYPDTDTWHLQNGPGAATEL